MQEDKVLKHLRKVEVESLTTVIVKQIRDLVKKGILKPGDRLPSESAMSVQMGVNRLQLREAIKQLEFFGLFRTVPQSGTFLSLLGPNTLDGLFASFLHKGKSDYAELMEVRSVLERRAVQLVVKNAADDEIQIIEKANDVFVQSIVRGERGLDEDIYVHLLIAGFTHNGALESVLAQLYSDILTIILKLGDIPKKRLDESIDEHSAIIEAVKRRDEQAAEKAMHYHMDMVCRMAAGPFKSRID
jgi:GntR family transcriptional repressor for pyruvate dehydrogenase complex